MPDPPPYGFRPEFAPYGQQGQSSGIQPDNISGIALSYSMPTPESGYQPFQPIITPLNRENLNGSSDSSSSSSDDTVSYHLDYTAYPPIGYCWQFLTTSDNFPYANAVRAGKDQDGSTIYVGRAFHEGDMIPAKVIPEKQHVSIAYNGEEVPKDEFEILRSGDFVWEFATNGEIPTGAIEIGRTADGEKLFMGRCLYQGSQTPGKIHPSHGCLYIPFDGEEVAVNEYEVLVVK